MPLKKQPKAKAHIDVNMTDKPNSTRFKKGQSGNPKGRPRKSMDFIQIIDEELREPTTVTHNGKRTKIGYWRANLKNLKANAAKGCKSAQRELIKLAMHPEVIKLREAKLQEPEKEPICPRTLAALEYEHLLIQAFMTLGVLKYEKGKTIIPDWVLAEALHLKPSLADELYEIEAALAEKAVWLWYLDEPLEMAEPVVYKPPQT